MAPVEARERARRVLDALYGVTSFRGIVACSAGMSTRPTT
jgi:hypothetical protein